MTKRPRPRAQEGRPPKLPYGIRDVQNSLNRHVLGIYVVRGILQIPRTDRLKKKKKKQRLWENRGSNREQNTYQP